MESLKRLKEKTDCPNVFTTGMPRTYSTASFDIASRALLYSPNFLFSVGPVIKVTITMMANSTVPKHNSPIRQSKRNISTASPIMVAYMPALSGSWWAR